MPTCLSELLLNAKCCQSWHKQLERARVCGGEGEPVLVQQQVTDTGMWGWASSRSVFIVICLHLKWVLLIFGYQRKCKDSFRKRTAKSGPRSFPGGQGGPISPTWGPSLPASGRYLLVLRAPILCPSLPSPGPQLPAWHWGRSLSLPCPLRTVSAQVAVLPRWAPATRLER